MEMTVNVLVFGASKATKTQNELVAGLKEEISLNSFLKSLFYNSAGYLILQPSHTRNAKFTVDFMNEKKKWLLFPYLSLYVMQMIVSINNYLSSLQQNNEEAVWLSV